MECQRLFRLQRIILSITLWYLILYQFLDDIMIVAVEKGKFHEFVKSIVHVDGRYNYISSIENAPKSGSTKGVVVPAIEIISKYPYLAIRILGSRMKDQVYTIKPPSWPTTQSSPTETLFNFTISNIPYSVFAPRVAGLANNKNRFLIRADGQLLLIITFPGNNSNLLIEFQRPREYDLPILLRKKLCDSESLFPGKWRMDIFRTVTEENKYQHCPIYGKATTDRAYVCPNAYQASVYFPSSDCSLLPLRVSLYLLYHYLEKETILNRFIEMSESGYNYSYYTFLGDSLNNQLVISANCEFENHYSLLDPLATFLSSKEASIYVGPDQTHSIRAGISILPIWNQYLRNDLPCVPKCLTDRKFLTEEGMKTGKFYYLPPPCKGCPEGKKKRHPYQYLKTIPKESRIVVMNGGAWYTEHFLVFNGTLLFRETLLHLLPHLERLQKERNYQLDLYFMTLPPVDPSLSKSRKFQWDEYRERNLIIYDVMERVAKQKYNLTITIVPNERWFAERKMLWDGTKISTPDALHYCVPSIWSPPTFLLEYIFHNHIRRRLFDEQLIS